jgi:hypothetical protein
MKTFNFLLCTLCVFVVAARADAGTLYGATASSGDGELYILNAATGGTVQDIGPLNDAAALNYNMTGLAFHPVSGVLYGSTGNSGANPAAAKARLVAINPATAQVTVIGQFNAGSGNTMTDLAFDPTSNKLYGVGSSGGPNLYEINIITGQATLVGSTGIGFTTGGGVEANSAGIVYGSPDGGRFGTYNKTTGAYSQIADPTPEPLGGGGYGALAFDGSVLYGVNVNGSGLIPHLVTIDVATAAVTDIGASVSHLDAIAFRSTSVPEPTPLMLLAFGLAVIAAGHRRELANGRDK